jgi:glutaredoxin
MNYVFPASTGLTIYTKSNCQYCSLIKELIERNNLEVSIVNCDYYLMENRERFLEYIHQITNLNYKTFPMVFYDGQFIGGYTETKKWIEQKNAFDDLTF